MLGQITLQGHGVQFFDWAHNFGSGCAVTKRGTSLSGLMRLHVPADISIVNKPRDEKVQASPFGCHRALSAAWHLTGKPSAPACLNWPKRACMLARLPGNIRAGAGNFTTT